jgi:hypothetical protein
MIAGIAQPSKSKVRSLSNANARLNWAPELIGSGASLLVARRDRPHQAEDGKPELTPVRSFARPGLLFRASSKISRPDVKPS